MIEDVTQMLAQKASQKGLELTCKLDETIPETLRGDPQRLRQIVVNLVNNAIKFTERGEVFVRASLAEEHDDHLLIRVAVRDTGIGVAPERLDRLFKMFSQVDASTTRKYGGTGLGLAISKQLAELMGGQIGVESELGKGTTFWFTARLAVGQTILQSTPSMPKIFGGLAALRILVVDDNDTHREVLCEQLSAWGAKDIATASTGMQALDVLRQFAKDGSPIHIGVLDMVMPKMTGLELAHRIKAAADVAGTALVMLSSMDVDLDAGEADAAGFVRVLTKPLRQSQLFDAMMEAAAWWRTPAGRTSCRSPIRTRHRASPNGGSSREFCWQKIMK